MEEITIILKDGDEKVLRKVAKALGMSFNRWARDTLVKGAMQQIEIKKEIEMMDVDSFYRDMDDLDDIPY